MLPTIIVSDESLLEKDGSPIKGAIIYEGHLRVHPENMQQVIDGLTELFEEGMEIQTMTIKEYKEKGSEHN